MRRSLSFTTIQLFLGLGLIAVPTLFTVFAFEFTDLAHWIKALVVVLWTVAATIFVYQGLRRDESISDLTVEVAQQRDNTRTVAWGLVFDSLLTTGHVFRDNYEFMAYLFVPNTGMLEPIWPRGMPSDEKALFSFAPGKGATGLAWKVRDLIVVTGAAVWDDTHALTEAQQERWRDHHAVAATPIWSDVQVALGVLTGISRVNDAYFDEPEGQALLREVAATLGLVLRATSGGG
jgi:hypothetical protein